MRTLTLVGVASLASLFAIDRAAADTPSLDQLPTGHIAAQNHTAPTAIPATEKVDGLFVSQPPEKQRLENEYNGQKRLLVTTDEKRAQEYAKTGRWYASSGTPATTCLEGTGDYTMQVLYIPAKPRPGQPRPIPRPQPAKPHGPSAKRAAPAPAQPRPHVRPVRTEHFAVTGETATLDIMDAWVDIESGGARLMQKTSVPLKRVSRGPAGMDIFAARDDKDVNFVVRVPQAPDEVKDQAGEQSLMAQLSDGSSASSSCGMLRFSLTNTQGEGQMANVIGSIVLKGRSPDDTEPEPDPQNDENGTTTPTPQKHFHTRPLMVGVSVSQTKSEQSPTLSITFGWTGKDQTTSF